MCVQAVLIVTLLPVVVVLVRLAKLLSDRKWGEHPRCRACRYIVLGLEGHVCPECGSDLREPEAVVGPVDADACLRKARRLWLIAVLLLVFGAKSILANTSFYRRVPSENAVLLESMQHPLMRVHVFTRGVADRYVRLRHDRPRGHGRAGDIWFDREDDVFRVGSAGGAELALSPDVDGLATWLSACEGGASVESAWPEARVLRGVLDEMVEGRSALAAGRRASGFRASATAYHSVRLGVFRFRTDVPLGIGAVLLWLLVDRWLVSAARRREPDGV